LQTETAARCDCLPEAPPPIDPACQPSGKQTASAEEAMAIYRQQIASLELEQHYRQQLLKIEQKMVKTYDHGILDVVDTVKEFGRSQIIDEIKKMAAAA
jgi:phosphoribosylaminoimidazole-succinocarboxamide synthase